MHHFAERRHSKQFIIKHSTEFDKVNFLMIVCAYPECGDVSTSRTLPPTCGAVKELPNSAPAITATAATVMIVLIRLFMFFDA